MLSKKLYSNRKLLSSTNTLIRFASTKSTGVENSEAGPTSFKTMKVIDPQHSDKPNVLILGSGWGAISFLKHIDTKKYNVSIISPRSYFLFTPLLPSAPVGTVDEKSINRTDCEFCS